MDAEKMIKVTTEIRVELMKEFPVSEKTVYNALTFATGGYAVEQIRRRALELGGKLMQEVTDTAEASPKDQRKETAFCPDCIMAKYPPCNEHIPCCKCEKKQNECNSWQPCPKKEGKEDAA